MPRIAMSRLALPIMALLAAALTTPGSASAHRMHINEMITESSIQRTWVRAMSADILRATLKIDEPGSLERLREMRARMVDSLHLLRLGGEELRNRGTEESERIFATVQVVTRQWTAFDDALRPALEEGVIDLARSTELLALNREVAGTIDRLHMIFHNAADHYGVVTVIGMAVMVTERERALSQRITASYLDVARRSDAGGRVALGEAMTEFETLLTALADGDPELGLIPAPTEDLRQQWQAVDAVWRQMKPYLSAASAGERQGRADVDRASALGARLMTELGRAGDMLSALVPGRRG